MNLMLNFWIKLDIYIYRRHSFSVFTTGHIQFLKLLQSLDFVRRHTFFIHKTSELTQIVFPTYLMFFTSITVCFKLLSTREPKFTS
jgi:hypothetical protein